MYIFLDVDGVLNTKAEWAKKAFSLNPDCIEAFCDLVKRIPDPKVVLSSTWRNGIARDGTTAVHITDLLQALKATGRTELDKTGFAPDGSRTKEIDHYLRRHPEDGYIILDDDPNVFDRKSDTPHLYLTSADSGITYRDVEKILNMSRR